MLKILKFLFTPFMFYIDPPAPGAGAPPPPAPGAGAPPPAASWYDGFENKELSGWVKAYNNAYPNPEAMAMKAYNLEKLMGADKAGKAVVIPDFVKGKPEELQAFWRKVGAGEKAEAYAVPATLKDDAIIGKFALHAHKLGMPVHQFNETVKWYEGEMKTHQQSQLNAFEAKAETELNEVYGEWGDKRDENVEMGRRAAQAFVPHSTPEELETLLNRMEGAMGTKFTLKFWANIGKSIGEHSLPNDASLGGGEGGGMTPEGARLKIAAYKSDKEWMKKFTAGDVDAKAEWTKLHNLGYPG